MKPIKIGTRKSELAMWQANKVQQLIEAQGFETVIIPLVAKGDIILDKPLYSFGITGVFTKHLDVAMLKEEIDIAVHSMKDVPTILPNHIEQIAVLERGNVRDVLVFNDVNFPDNVIATGSLRRKAQWRYKNPGYLIEGIRGNVNTRLKKLKESNWEGSIFAAAGLERINLMPKNIELLDWMIPAPAQGIVMVVGNKNNSKLKEIGQLINDKSTERAAHIERQFLATLEGGCTAPIGAYARLEYESIVFDGCLHDVNGTKGIYVSDMVDSNNWKNLGKRMANQILKNGGKEIMQNLK